MRMDKYHCVIDDKSGRVRLRIDGDNVEVIINDEYHWRPTREMFEQLIEEFLCNSTGGI